MDSLEWLCKEHGNKYKRSFHKLKEFAEKLESHFWKPIDPIQYIIYLYFERELNYEEVFEITKKHWLDYKYARGLYAMLRNVLEWEFRWWEGMVDWKRKKQRELWEETRNNNNQKVILRNLDIFNIAVSEIIKKSSNNREIFSLEKYKEIKSPVERVFYLLWCFTDLDISVLFQIKQSTELWARSIVRAVNNEVSKICREQNIETVPELKVNSLLTRFETLERRWIQWSMNEPYIETNY